MGQKINPTGLRLGIIKGWESSWYGGKNFSEKIVEDHKIRNYIALRIPRGGISKVVIERTMKLLEITIHTARPGIIIGKGGSEVDKLKNELKKKDGQWISSKFAITMVAYQLEKLGGRKLNDTLTNFINYAGSELSESSAYVKAGK